MEMHVTNMIDVVVCTRKISRLPAILCGTLAFFNVSKKECKIGHELTITNSRKLRTCDLLHNSQRNTVNKFSARLWAGYISLQPPKCIS